MLFEAKVQLESKEFPEHGHVVSSAGSVFGLAGKVEEIDIFETGFDGTEAVAGTGIGVDADLMKAAYKMSRNDVEGTFESAEIIVGSDYF
jgi:hypothetical protein